MEQVGVEHLLSAGFVEAFDERVLGRFSGLDASQGDVVLVSPLGELMRDEFGSVVQSQPLRESTPLLYLIEHADDALGWQ